MRAIDRVVERLEGVKAHNGNFTARCPAHEDADPSLSIGEGDDGRVLLKCFAGCTAEDIVAALGLEMSDLFPEGGGGGVTPLIARAQVHTPDTTELKLVKGGRENPENVTLEAYAEYVKLPVEFLKQLGLRELHYVDQRAVKMPYLDETGEEVCVRFRISLDGKPKVKTRKNDKHRLYGLQSLGEMKKAGYAILAEGESDTQVGWHHSYPVLGVPGGTGFQSEWISELEGFEKVYAIVEPDETGEKFWQRFAVEPDLRERLFRVELRGAKDLRELHVQDPDHFEERLKEALEGARHWMDIAETEVLENSRLAWEKCASLAAEEDILERFSETLHASGVAGEENIARILYLALTSRRLDRPVSVALKGPSSGGKSYLVEQVSKHFPESAVYALTGMSEKALAYSEEPIKHRFLLLFEASGMNSDFQTYLLRSLLSEGRLRYETLEKGDKGIEARVIEREGPTGLIVTTTLARLHAENETRLISTTVTDTPEQTSQILETLADEDLVIPDREEWIALQQWIEGAAQRVTIPFSKELARLVPPVAVRLRRDFKAILNLVKAHALLHQATREHDDEGRVIATVSGDYAAVRELVADLVAEGVEASVSQVMRETVAVVGKLLAGAGADEDDEDALFATVRQVADELELDRSAAQRRLYDAASRGYLKNLESRKGRTARYRLGDPLPEDVVVLPTPRELTLCTCAPVHAGSGGYDPLPPRRLTTEEVLTIRRRVGEGMSQGTAIEAVLAKGP